LQLLRDKGITPKVIEYLQTPPDAETLKHILDLLNQAPRKFMRTKEEAYGANGLADENLDESQLIAAMIANPVLIERPVVLANGKAAVGRPPETVLEIL
jgi:arsenate reductase